MRFSERHIQMEKETSKHLLLTFYRSALLYDIKNLAFIEGDIIPDENIHAKHLTQDIGEEGNIDRVERVLDLTFAHIIEVCYPYTKKIVADGTNMNDLPTTAHDYAMDLTVPEDFSETTEKLIKEYVHNLLVYRVLEDWFSIVNPDAAANWRTRADEIETNLLGCLNARCGRRRRPMRPFV